MKWRGAGGPREGARAVQASPSASLTGVLLVLSVAVLGLSLSLQGSPPGLHVDVAGCDVRRAPPEAGAPTICRLGGRAALAAAAHGPAARRLTLSIQTPSWAAVKLLVDGKPVEGERLPALPGAPEDGRGPVAVDVYEGASELTVTAETAGRATAVRIPLVTEGPSREEGEVDRAWQLRGEGHAEEAQHLAEALARSADPPARARATALLARLVRPRDPGLAAALFDRALTLDREAGLVSDEVADAFAFAVALVFDRRDLRRADQVLDGIEPLLRLVPAGQAMAPRFRSMVALGRGDLGAALDLLEESEARAVRLDLAAHVSEVYQHKLEVLDLLGRHEEARRVRQLLDDPRLAPLGPCPRAHRATNLAWHALLTGTLDDPSRAELEEAARILGQGCGGPGARRNVLTNLARWAIAGKGRLDEAEETLERALREQPDAPPAVAADWAITYGHLEIARSRPAEARRRFADAVAESRAAGLPDRAVEAQLGLAEALEGLDLPADALAAYAAADAELERWSVLVPFGAGKQTFLGRYDRGLRRYLDLLVRRAEGTGSAEDARRAACTARRSRARMRIFAEWQRRLAAAPAARRADLDQAIERAGPAGSSEEAARDIDEAARSLAGAPLAMDCAGAAPGEALLVYHPLPHGWAAFVLTSEGARVRRLDLDEATIRSWKDARGPTPATVLLQPFADVLDDPSLRRVRLLPAEPLAELDLHRLTFRGAPLAQRFSVTYGVDSARAPRAESNGKLAVVVAISGGEWNLYSTATEAKAVTAALEGDGWKVITRDGRSATRAEVKRLLEREDVGLFHYAGHGFRRGRDAWDSYLTLAGDDRLTIGDVLGLRRVPPRIVLSSCETDAAGEGAAVTGLGLAPAFVLAGADAAVAMRTDPKDFLMKAVMTDLYGRHLSAFLYDPATALQATAADLARDLPGVDPPALRVLVP